MMFSLELLGLLLFLVGLPPCKLQETSCSDGYCQGKSLEQKVNQIQDEINQLRVEMRELVQQKQRPLIGTLI